MIEDILFDFKSRREELGFNKSKMAEACLVSEYVISKLDKRDSSVSYINKIRCAGTLLVLERDKLRKELYRLHSAQPEYGVKEVEIDMKSEEIEQFNNTY